MFFVGKNFSDLVLKSLNLALFLSLLFTNNVQAGSTLSHMKSTETKKEIELSVINNDDNPILKAIFSQDLNEVRDSVGIRNIVVTTTIGKKAHKTPRFPDFEGPRPINSDELKKQRAEEEERIRKKGELIQKKITEFRHAQERHPTRPRDVNHEIEYRNSPEGVKEWSNTRFETTYEAYHGVQNLIDRSEQLRSVPEVKEFLKYQLDQSLAVSMASNDLAHNGGNESLVRSLQEWAESIEISIGRFVVGVNRGVIREFSTVSQAIMQICTDRELARMIINDLPGRIVKSLEDGSIFAQVTEAVVDTWNTLAYGTSEEKGEAVGKFFADATLALVTSGAGSAAAEAIGQFAIEETVLSTASRLTIEKFEANPILKEQKQIVMKPMDELKEVARLMGVPEIEVNVVTQEAYHVFRPDGLEKHGLLEYLAQNHNNKVEAFLPIRDAAQDLVNAGKFLIKQYNPITVNGIPMVVKGEILNGRVRIGTAFIPQ